MEQLIENVFIDCVDEMHKDIMDEVLKSLENEIVVETTENSEILK